MAEYSPVVACAEIRDTATSAIGIDGVSASVSLQCAWGDRVALAQDLLNFRRFWPYAIGAGAPRVANITSITGWGESTLDPGSSGQLFIWTQARLDVEYAPLAADVPTQPAGYDLVLETLDGEADGRRLSDHAYKWATDGASISPGDAPTRQLYPLRIAREYIGLSALPIDAFNLVGYVNDAPYISSILGLTFPAETLKLNFPYASRTLRTDGSDGWNLQLSFTYKHWGHNAFWRNDGQDPVTSLFTGAYEKMKTKLKDEDYIHYPLGDFSNLFQ